MNSTRTALEDILTTRTCRSHEDIQHALAQRGIHITQASISRALARLGAIKTHQPDGTIAYRLHKGTVTHRPNAPISRVSVAHYMADRIIANGTLITILGKPDSGRVLGTYVDDAALPSVAGTIAGGNTLLIIPFNQKHYQSTCHDIQKLFPHTPIILNT